MVSCGAGQRFGLDLAWLGLWCRLAAAAWIRPLAWEPSYAAGAALKQDTHTQKPNKVTTMLPVIQAGLGSNKALIPH